MEIRNDGWRKRERKKRKKDTREDKEKMEEGGGAPWEGRDGYIGEEVR